MAQTDSPTLAAYVWLRNEIRYARYAKLGVLEWAGAFSYSMYLVHQQAAVLFTSIVGHFDSPWLWPLKIGFILAFSYVFYRLVERPSHHAARSVQRRVSEVLSQAKLRDSA